MEQHRPIAEMVQDPVCGKQVVPGTARGWDYRFEETVYHFCGSECRSRFNANPQGVLSAGPGQPDVPLVLPAESTPSASLVLIKKWWTHFFQR